jgi:hypothetical protein
MPPQLEEVLMERIRLIELHPTFVIGGSGQCSAWAKVRVNGNALDLVLKLKDLCEGARRWCG